MSDGMDYGNVTEPLIGQWYSMFLSLKKVRKITECASHTHEWRHLLAGRVMRKDGRRKDSVTEIGSHAACPGSGKYRKNSSDPHIHEIYDTYYLHGLMGRGLMHARMHILNLFVNLTTSLTKNLRGQMLIHICFFDIPTSLTLWAYLQVHITNCLLLVHLIILCHICTPPGQCAKYLTF